MPYWYNPIDVTEYHSFSHTKNKYEAVFKTLCQTDRVYNLKVYISCSKIPYVLWNFAVFTF